MLTRDSHRPEERTRHSLKPLFSHFFLPTPTTIARLDIRLRRAALYPAELRVLEAWQLHDGRNRSKGNCDIPVNTAQASGGCPHIFAAIVALDRGALKSRDVSPAQL